MEGPARLTGGCLCGSVRIVAWGAVSDKQLAYACRPRERSVRCRRAAPDIGVLGHAFHEARTAKVVMPADTLLHIRMGARSLVALMRSGRSGRVMGMHSRPVSSRLGTVLVT